MSIWASWLTAIAAASAVPGQPFQASWQYIAAAVLLPALIGAVAALCLRAVEKLGGIRLGGGGV